MTSGAITANTPADPKQDTTSRDKPLFSFFIGLGELFVEFVCILLLNLRRMRVIEQLCRQIRLGQVHHVRSPINFYDEMADTLGKTLANNQQITKIYLNLFKITKKHESLLDFIASSRRLKQVTIDGDKKDSLLVSSKITSEYLKAISLSRTIKRVTFQSLELHPVNLVDLFSCKAPLQLLEILDCRLHYGTLHNINKVARAFASNTTIECLSYQSPRNQFIKRKRLLEDPELLHLKMDSSKDQLLQCFVRGLPRHPMVRHLVLDMPQHRHYRRMDEIHLQLLQAIAENTSVQKILWRNTGYNRDERTQIHEYLERNKSLATTELPAEVTVEEVLHGNQLLKTNP
jgi:hypothetical protein